VGQARGQLAVVGEEQESLRVVVQPADRVDVFLHAFQEIHDRRPSLGVASGRHVAARLVEQDVALPLLRLDAPPVDLDLVLVGIGLRSQRADRLPVDLDAPLGDQLLGGPARGDPRGRNDLL
jgi:hypothetical protein